MRTFEIQGNPPLIRQLAAAVFGVVFAYTDGHHWAQFIIFPIVFAGIVRLSIGLYRLVTRFLPGGIISEIVAIVGVGLVLDSFVQITMRSELVEILLAVFLALWEMATFAWDFYVWKCRREAM